MSNEPQSTIYTDLATAQQEMGAALKNAKNPHFKSDYADLKSVQEACMSSLNKHGFAVLQPFGQDEMGQYVDTIFAHKSGEKISSRIYLLLQKKDMQGLGSAQTYARRYGLMGLAGIAPADDDGNGSIDKNFKPAAKINGEQFLELRKLLETSGVDEAKILKAYGSSSLQEFDVNQFDSAVKRLSATIKKNANASESVAA